MANKIYNKGLANFFNGTIDWDTDTFKLMLLDNTYTVDKDHDFTDVIGEVSGTGYTAGGFTLTTKTVVQDDGNDKVQLTCDDPSWVGLNAGLIQQAVIYQSTGTPATSTPLLHIQDGLPQTPIAADFVLQIQDGVVLEISQV
ncbi:MAG: hypothetical protein KKA84_12125 [Bacteroidetes bacterium]|nr:hypothetical protein [Bacteroidota bacterium]